MNKFDIACRDYQEAVALHKRLCRAQTKIISQKRYPVWLFGELCNAIDSAGSLVIAIGRYRDEVKERILKGGEV